MKFIYMLTSLSLLLLPLSCYADISHNNSVTVVELLNNFLPNQVKLKKNDKPIFKLGDFNGDGLEDIVRL